MVTQFPSFILTYSERMKLIKYNANLYRKSKKKEKTEILDELSKITGLNRKYVSYLLRKAGKEVYMRGSLKVRGDPEVNNLKKRGRKKYYTEDLLPYLEFLWELSGFVSSKHLCAFIRLNREEIFSHPIFKNVKSEIKEKLLKMSASTIERFLKPIRDKMKVKKRYRRNPYASHIKKSIPVQSYFDKPKKKLGYVEIDLVFHCGESARGDFAYTLTATDIRTGWTELRVLKNRARIWTLSALKDIKESFPFTIRHIHSDNGSEFINAHLLNWVKREGISFTRSRAFRKNDAPYVESRNWNMVRVYTGYRRYDTEEEVKILSELMKLVSIKHNFFMPSMKLIKKERISGKVVKKYEINTPYNRIMSIEEIPQKQREKLKKLKENLNLFEIILKIENLKQKLDKIYKEKFSKNIRRI